MWLYHGVMCPKDADGMANSVDPDRLLSDCLLRPVQKLGIIMLLNKSELCNKKRNLMVVPLGT